MKHYECDGQMNIFEFLKSERIHPVEIKGLCDDAYCPECGYEFWETREMDCERCPVCGTRVDWTPWHMANDEEGRA